MAEFERYVANVVIEMGNPEYPKDIEAEITFLTSEAGGRETPILSGYRPQVYYDGYGWTAIQTYIGVVEPVLPGQTVIAHLSFTSPQYQVGKLKPGKEFLLCEGSRVVGRGKVTKILDLEKSAKEAEAREAQRHGTTEGAT